MLKGIAEAADYPHWIVGDVVLLEASIYECLKIAVDKLLDVRVRVMRQYERAETAEPAGRRTGIAIDHFYNVRIFMRELLCVLGSNLFRHQSFDKVGYEEFSKDGSGAVVAYDEASGLDMLHDLSAVPLT